MKIEKSIFFYWDRGIENAPELVKHNFSRWKQLHPEWSIIVLDSHSAEEYLQVYKFDTETLIPQTKSDLLRYALLRKHGGFWIDATVFPVVPLDIWFKDALADADLFCFFVPFGWRRMDNWFLYADPESVSLDIWFERILQFWCKSRSFIDTTELQDSGFTKENRFEPLSIHKMTQSSGILGSRYLYLWSQFIFEELVIENEKFSGNWNKIAKLDGMRCAEVQFYLKRNDKNVRKWIRRLMPIADRYKIYSYMKHCPVLKLDWREKYNFKMLDKLSDYIIQNNIQIEQVVRAFPDQSGS
jgi:hypothetical protein